jgi:superfamily I DNA/RNA helicase
MRKEVKVKIISHPTDRSEAEFVARTIEKMVGGLRFFSMDSQISSGEQEEGITSLSDFAVLCRIGRQMSVLEKAFADHSIPYQKVAEDPFFRQKPVRTILDLMRLAHHPANRFLFQRIQKEDDVIPFHPEQIRQTVKGLSLSDAIMVLSQSLFKNRPDPDDLNLKKLSALAKSYGNKYDQFLQFTALGTSADTLQAETEGVRLMTLHASKGLEFRCVFIVGCEEGLLPYSLFESKQADPEEERRLLYVGMTRAMKYLYLNHALQRSLMGKIYHPRRSSFLDQIEKDLTESIKVQVPRKTGEDQLSLF